jgi:adenylate cyclase
MIYQFEKFRVDTASRELFCGDRSIPVEPRALRLLEYLIENRERSVSKDELQDKVWGTIVGDAAIARCVTKLRKALGDTADSPRLLRTVRGHGYQFIAALDRGNGSTDDPAAHGTVEWDRPSIAVLPLTNIGGDQDSIYFSDGIADEILCLLARVPDLRVLSRTSSFQYRDRDSDLRAIAEKLGVDFVLEGSIRRQQSRVRIAMQLVDAQRDANLWSEIFDRQLTDIFAVQSEIASSVVANLRIATRGTTRRHDPTTSIDAYDYYLRGRYYFHSWTDRSMEYARQMYLRAIAIDSEFAKAWAGLAETATCEQMWQDHSGERLKLAQQASIRAMEIAPEQAESRCARGFVLSLTGEYAKSFAEFDRAIELDPMLFDAWYLYGRSKFAAGELIEAAGKFDRAGELRPDDIQSPCLQALALLGAKASEAEVHAAANEGVRRCRRRLELQPDDLRALSLGSAALIKLGRNDEAMEWADLALQIAPNDITVLHNIGCAKACAGFIDEGLDLLERRFEMGSAFADWIQHDAELDAIREHPRFLAMLRT